MAEIQPFRAYRYDTNRVAPADVLTQPYDKISPAMQERYYAASPYNLITIEKGRALPGDSPENNVYTRAAKTVDEWIAEKILQRDAAPAIYVYSQEFEVPGTHARRERIGFIALTRVEDYDAQVVFRHERTLSAPKADRIELLRQTRAQTGQLFLLYDDPARQIDSWLEEAARAKPALELRDEYGVTHRLWPVTDPAFVARVQKAMAQKKLVIADGHHRYETALHYRDECRARAGKHRSHGRVRIRDGHLHQYPFARPHDPAHASHRRESRRISISIASAKPSRRTSIGTRIHFSTHRGARGRLRRIPQRSRKPQPRPPRDWRLCGR